MPPTAHRRSARKREATSRKLEHVEGNDSSPSRPAKRRRQTKTDIAPARASPEVDDAATQDNEDASSDTANDATFAEPADKIVPYLAKASYSVVVALEHPNKLIDDGTISAFAKIAGREWTYYVRDPAINIGRSPEASSRQSTELAARSSPGAPVDDPMVAHIDLGPSKHVSRLHAKLFYQSEDERWHLSVNGRNGVRINDGLIKKGQEMVLNSGDVIEIAGTEMIFVSPDVLAVIQSKYYARIEQAKQAETMETWNNQVHAHPQAPAGADQALSPPISLTRPFPNGQAVIAPAPAPEPAPQHFVRPSTPETRSPAKAAHVVHATTQSPAYGHGIMMESNEQIDYSSDAMKDVKPPCSYATLIAQAILSGPDEKLSLNNIYEWIKAHFSYYRHIDGGWQNSIRHNLSLNPAFQKVARESHEPGKGSKWYIVEEKKDEFRNLGFKMTSRGGARRASAPNSPVPKRSPRKSPPKSELGTSHQVFKASPTARTPPLSAYPPVPQESYTPSRGSRVSALGHADSRLPQLSDDASPLPRNRPYTKNAAAAGSPPLLSSSAYVDEHHHGYNLYTPAPQRHEPRLTAPSTAKLPSQYLPQSSPAPFWRLEGLGSTPARLPDTSPLKGVGPSGAEPLQSSSPPPLANGSPTRARGLPIDNGANGQGRSQGLGIHSREVEMDDDDDQIDLMGRFPKIGDRKMVSSAAH